LFLRDYGDTEVGGFGIAAADDLLLVEDVQLVQQVCSWAGVVFCDESVADFFDDQVDSGRQPEQFARIWVHTHPGDCPLPSATDEATFARVFGRSDWAVMFILACSGESYARLRFNVGPGGALEIPVQVDYSCPFAGANAQAWEQEHLLNVQPESAIELLDSEKQAALASPFGAEHVAAWRDDWLDYAKGDETEEGFIV